MDTNFSFWFYYVYGEKQFKELEAISRETGKELYDCVNFDTQLRFWDAEHNSGGWLEPKDKTSWRN